MRTKTKNEIKALMTPYVEILNQKAWNLRSGTGLE